MIVHKLHHPDNKQTKNIRFFPIYFQSRQATQLVRVCCEFKQRRLRKVSVFAHRFRFGVDLIESFYGAILAFDIRQKWWTRDFDGVHFHRHRIIWCSMSSKSNRSVFGWAVNFVRGFCWLLNIRWKFSCDECFQIFLCFGIIFREIAHFRIK